MFLVQLQGLVCWERIEGLKSIGTACSRIFPFDAIYVQYYTVLLKRITTLLHNVCMFLQQEKKAPNIRSWRINVVYFTLKAGQQRHIVTVHLEVDPAALV